MFSSSSSDSKESFQKMAEDARKRMSIEYKDQENHPNVHKALDMYDEQMDKIKQATDTEAARKAYEELEKAKKAVKDAFEAAKNTPEAQSMMGKASEMGQAAKEKASELGEAAKEKLAEAKEKVVG